LTQGTRGSGAPLISTTLRAEEALNGIPHALGITVPSSLLVRADEMIE